MGLAHVGVEVAVRPSPSWPTDTSALTTVPIVAYRHVYRVLRRRRPPHGRPRCAPGGIQIGPGSAKYSEAFLGQPGQCLCRGLPHNPLRVLQASADSNSNIRFVLSAGLRQLMDCMSPDALLLVFQAIDQNTRRSLYPETASKNLTRCLLGPQNGVELCCAV